MSDVQELRRVMSEDDAPRSIEEAERIATDRPVLASRMLRSGAMVAARTQLERVHADDMSSEQGRELAHQLHDAYEDRLRGLEVWQRYLEDAATDDELLLESTRTLREAEEAILAVDREMETLVSSRTR